MVYILPQKLMNNDRQETRHHDGRRSGGSGDGGRGGGTDNNGGQRQNIIPIATAQNTATSSAVKRDSSGIPIRIREHAGDSGQPTTRIRELPTWLAQGSENLELQYWKGFQKRCNRIFEELQRSDGQLVRDVLRFEDAQECKDFLRCLQKDRS